MLPQILECLKYAHEKGCPWDEETCSKAAYNGHLDAHENGCPWDEGLVLELPQLECKMDLRRNGRNPTQTPTRRVLVTDLPRVHFRTGFYFVTCIFRAFHSNI